MCKLLRLIAAAKSSSFASASTSDEVHYFVAAYSAAWNRDNEHELAKLFEADADFID